MSNAIHVVTYDSVSARRHLSTLRSLEDEFKQAGYDYREEHLASNVELLAVISVVGSQIVAPVVVHALKKLIDICTDGPSKKTGQQQPEVESPKIVVQLVMIDQKFVLPGDESELSKTLETLSAIVRESKQADDTATNKKADTHDRKDESNG